MGRLARFVAFALSCGAIVFVSWRQTRAAPSGDESPSLDETLAYVNSKFLFGQDDIGGKVSISPDHELMIFEKDKHCEPKVDCHYRYSAKVIVLDPSTISSGRWSYRNLNTSATAAENVFAEVRDIASVALSHLRDTTLMRDARRRSALNFSQSVRPRKASTTSHLRLEDFRPSVVAHSRCLRETSCASSGSHPKK